MRKGRFGSYETMRSMQSSSESELLSSVTFGERKVLYFSLTKLIVSFQRRLGSSFDVDAPEGTTGGMVATSRFVLGLAEEVVFGLAPRQEDRKGVSSSSSEMVSSTVTIEVRFEDELGRNVVRGILSDLSKRTLDPGSTASIGGGMMLGLSKLDSVGEVLPLRDENLSLKGSSRSFSQAEKTTMQWIIATTAISAMQPTRT